jgi:RNA recognition motif-containing protein
MSFTVFLGNLPIWVTADDIKGWLQAENLVADAIKVIRNPETQESKGFAFIEAPNTEEMNAIIRRFDRAPLEDRLLRANPAQPPKPKSQGPPSRPPSSGSGGHFREHAREQTGSHAGGQPGGQPTAQPSGQTSHAGPPAASAPPASAPASQAVDRPPPRRGKKSNKRNTGNGPQSPFAEELAKAL